MSASAAVEVRMLGEPGRRIGVLVGVLVGSASVLASPDPIRVPTLAAGETWQLPFDAADRRDPRGFRVVSEFGAPRLSYVRGHIHTGLDVIPRRARQHPIDVLAMARGVVRSVHLSDPHQTVVVEHRLADGGSLFTSYKHLARVDVAEGQAVTAQTRVGVLYSRAQARALGGNYDHLHLEIRTRFDDEGAASWTTMTREDLALRFVDPLPFLRSALAPASAPAR